MSMNQLASMDHLHSVLTNQMVDQSGLLLALNELKLYTVDQPICGLQDLKVLVCDAIDGMNLQDAGQL